MPLFQTRIVAVGPDAPELAEGGVLILFGADAPPELAEVSVLHDPAVPPSETGPAAGAPIVVGPLSATITAVGPYAWKKVAEIGHVVINFNGATSADRPGEICATAVDPEALVGALAVGNSIVIG